MISDMTIGLVETILEDYNKMNNTRIKLEDLDIEEIKTKVEELIWCQIEHCDK